MTEIRIPDFLIAGADADDGGPDGGDTLLGRVRPHTELGRYARLMPRDRRTSYPDHGPVFNPDGGKPFPKPGPDGIPDLDRDLETHRLLKRLFEESAAAMAALDRHAGELERDGEPSQ
ncbi:MAG: hypothetical protein ACKVSF_10255, partial [Alphaproteobacteria bacterium]